MKITDKQISYIMMILEKSLFNKWVQSAEDHHEYNFFHPIGKERVEAQLHYLDRKQASTIIEELKANNYTTLKKLM